jgi:hypothetical protein
MKISRLVRIFKMDKQRKVNMITRQEVKHRGQKNLMVRYKDSEISWPKQEFSWSLPELMQEKQLTRLNRPSRKRRNQEPNPSSQNHSQEAPLLLL